MDVIGWAVGLVAGMLLPLPRAFAAGALAAVSVTAYQHFLADPQVWAGNFPADWIGATAMVVVSCLFAYIGSIVRTRRMRRADA